MLTALIDLALLFSLSEMLGQERTSRKMQSQQLQTFIQGS